MFSNKNKYGIVFYTFVLIFVILSTSAYSQVQVSIEKMTLTTYGWGVDNNPRLAFDLPVKTLDIECYPYAAHDVITDQVEEKIYNAVILENEFIRLVILPEVGGRIQGAIDKVNGWDFLQYNHVIKPTLTSTLIGAWQSGGLEWNFPGGHRASGLDKVNYRIIENSDGSKTVWLGEIEPLYRMKWVVGVTVFPEKSFFKIDTKFINSTPFKHQFGSWFNAAVHATPETQIIFPPSAWSATHGIPEIWDWPIIDGIDYSFIKSAKHSVSFFSMNDQQDFFGCYHHDEKTGTVHIADHFTVPGKKFFYWGNDQRSHVYELNQTDDDGNYVELQAGGNVNNQGHGHAWLDPYVTKTMEEYWYPIREIGAFKYANRDMVVNLDSTKNGDITFAVMATGVFPNSEISLTCNSDILFKKRLSLTPQNVIIETLKKPENISFSDIVLAVRDENNKTIAKYAADIKRETAPVHMIPVKPQDPLSIEELLIKADNAGFSLMAEDLLNNVLTMDPGNARAYQLLGEIYVNWAMYPRAIDHLQKSLKRDPFNNSGQTYYYLGLAQLSSGSLEKAKESFWKATYRTGFGSPAYLALAEIAFAEKAFENAEELLQNSLQQNARNTRAKSLLVTLNRLNGKTDKALTMAKDVLDMDPINHLALWEKYRANLVSKDILSAKKALDDFVQCAGYTDSYYLDLANSYRSAGLYGEAIAVLEQAEKSVTTTSPITIYNLGYCLLQTGKIKDAERYFIKAAQKSPTGVFPYRRETIPVLTKVLQLCPDDAQACYYLGNLLYAKHQENEAIRLWERSKERNAEFSTVHRNLANAYWARGEDVDTVIQNIKKAQELDPLDARLYTELVRMYLAGSDLNECLTILEKNQKVVNEREDTPKFQAAIYLVLGEYDKAIRLIHSRKWHSWEWEGDIGNHAIYSISYIERGKKFLERKKYNKALNDFEKALEWPLFLGVGSLPEISCNMIHYFIGKCYEGLGESDKARAYWTKAVDQKLQKVSIAFYYRGLAAECLGQEEEANKCFRLLTEIADENIALKKDLPVAYILKAKSLESVGQQEESMLYYQKALELDKLAEFRAIGQSWDRIQMVSPPARF